MDVPQLADRENAGAACPRAGTIAQRVGEAAPTPSAAGRTAGPDAGGMPAMARPGTFQIATVLVVAAVIAVRVWPLIRFHMFGGTLEYDDGVYYAASAHLVGGDLPYRDFIFVQPPGITLLLAPFTALAKVSGDQTALILARLGVVAVAAANAYLIMRLLRRWAGPVAAVAAAGIYAAWGGAAATERTILLEPFLGLGLLGAMTLLSDRLGPEARATWRPGRRVVLAGVVLGLAMAVKTWAVADVAVLAIWLLVRGGWRTGWRAALALAGSAAGAAAVVCLPFFIAAPGAMVHEVITSQLGRAQRLTDGPIVFLHQVTGVGRVYRPIGASTILILAVVLAFVLAVLITFLRGPRIWAVLAVVQAALVLPQVSFTYHYMDFAAPALAACAGVATDAALGAVRRLSRWAVLLPAAVIAAFAGLLAYQAATEDVIGNPVPASLGAFVTAHRCTFSDFPAVLAVSGGETPQVRRNCPNFVDYTGAAFTVDERLTKVTRSNGTRHFFRPEAWQAEVRAIMAKSDAAVLTWRPEMWTPETSRFFHNRFRLVRKDGVFKYWVLRAPGS